MTQHEQGNGNIETYLRDRQVWIQDAVEVLGAERSADPLEVLPAATEVRDDAEALDLSSEQQAQLREIAGRFGVGGEADVVANTEVQILEGGKPWKIEAEAAISGDSQTVIFAASQARKVGQDELTYMANGYGLDVEELAEYDVAREVATRMEGFTPLDEAEVLPFGYTVDEENAYVGEATGQLVQLGDISGRPVLLMRVDRDYYENDQGATQYRQPDGAALMRVVSEILRASGDESSGVGLVTSNTYASRAIDAVRAGLDAGRFFGVGMYGRQTLAEVGGTPPEPTPINQIPGELHSMHQKLLSLQAEIEEIPGE